MKYILDHKDLSNYRPVSNLAFLSKLLEHLVAARLKKHLNDSGITNVKHTSGAAALIILDLSASFDTLDHSILLDCFQHLFDLQDNV